MTIKKPKGRSVGIFTRQEIERTISEKDYINLKNSQFHKIINEHFHELEGQKIVHIVTVQNERIQFSAHRNGEAYKIAVDRIQFIDTVTGNRSSHRLEIEIEAVGTIAQNTIDSIKTGLCNIFPEFIFSDKTKYEAALDFVNNIQAKKTISTWRSYILSVLVLLIGITLLINSSHIPLLSSLNTHSKRVGIYGCIILILASTCWSIAFKRGRHIALWVVGIGAILTLFQIL